MTYRVISDVDKHTHYICCRRSISVTDCTSSQKTRLRRVSVYFDIFMPIPRIFQGTVIMKKVYLFSLLVLSGVAQAQKTDKYIIADDVSRIIRTLSDDSMMGRSSMQPEYINRAAAFIESEFKSIGLEPLNGNNSFRQEFRKERVRPDNLEVFIDGARIPADDAVLVSERAKINVSQDSPFAPYGSTPPAPSLTVILWTRRSGLYAIQHQC